MSDNTAARRKLQEIDAEIALHFSKLAKVRRQEIDVHTINRHIRKIALQEKLRVILTAEELDLL